MNYQFPDINHISDVLPHIQGRDEIRVMEKDWYTVINYAVAFEDTFSPVCDISYDGILSLVSDKSHYNMTIRRECRGLIFDTKTGQIISRPYHKFFNVGEKEETQLNKVNLFEPHIVLEKLDGSMIRPIPTEDINVWNKGFRLATRAGITDVAMNAEVFIADKPQYADFIQFMIYNVGSTPIFEWVSRKNRIVLDYPEDNLILTAVRNITTGEYVPYQTLVVWGKHFNIPVVKAIAGDETDITKVVEHIRKWDDGEGVVIRFDDGHMVKIKADDYVLRHRSKDSISQEKNVLQTVLEDSVDDLVPLLTPEDADRLRDFQSAFWASVLDVCIDMDHLFQIGNKKYPDKKDFAVQYVQKETLPIYAPIMYGMKGGRGSKDVIMDMIRKSLSSQTKIDQNRWLWGNLNWN